MLKKIFCTCFLHVLQASTKEGGSILHPARLFNNYGFILCSADTDDLPEIQLLQDGSGPFEPELLQGER